MGTFILAPPPNPPVIACMRASIDPRAPPVRTATRRNTSWKIGPCFLKYSTAQHAYLPLDEPSYKLKLSAFVGGTAFI